MKRTGMEELLSRITVKDDICNGQPCIRGMRITVKTILEFLLNDTSEEELLEQYPILEKDDLKACKQFAIELMNNKYHVKEFAA